MKQSRITQSAWIENLKRSALIALAATLKHNEHVEKSGEGKLIELTNDKGEDIVQIAAKVIAQFEKVQSDAEAVLKNLQVLDKMTGFAGQRKPESIVFYVRFEGDEPTTTKVTSQDELLLEDARRKYTEGSMTVSEFAEIVSKLTTAKITK